MAISTVTTANLSYFRRGSQFPNFQTARGADFQRLKDSGADHVVFVPRPWALYPGGGLPPTFAISQGERDQLLRSTDLAMAKGLRVDWHLDFTRDEIKKVYDNKDWSRFDTGYAQALEMANTCDLTRLRVEILPEPGWTSYVANWPKDEALRSITTDLESFWAHAVPYCQSLSRCTLKLGTPGYGHFVGPGEFKFITAVYPNVVHDFRYYQHFEFTHNGTPPREMKPLSWPEPNWKTFFPELTGWENDYAPWSIDGMRQHLRKITDWRAQTGRKIHISEAGPLTAMRNTPAGQAWISDFKTVCAELDVRYSLWGQ